ncbi:helix-turn-helix domain-containing protein [Allokutzneria multivorans]|uniref:Helix-turn-helix domain-containing protein n=1 Tax=Allokutzneria multivorans TaxID=1142134 RepID=A0ABP7T5T3_9PSEU
MDPAALPETCCAPTLWLLPGRAAYLGPSLRLDTHSGSVHCLALGVDSPFLLSSAETGQRKVRSALITARTPHLVEGDGRMLFCYLDRIGELRSAMAEQHLSVHFGHRDEERFARDPRQAVQDLLGASAGEIDSRVASALRLLRARPDASAAETAAAVNLSTSRFLHLFSEHAATSFRRYRLWARMLRVAEAVNAGANLTTAAVDAGFASPGHFSDAFHTMFGLTASAFLASRTRVITVV